MGERRGGKYGQWLLLRKMVWEREVTAKCRTGRKGKTYVRNLGEGEKKKIKTDK